MQCTVRIACPDTIYFVAYCVNTCDHLKPYGCICGSVPIAHLEKLDCHKIGMKRCASLKEVQGVAKKQNSAGPSKATAEMEAKRPRFVDRVNAKLKDPFCKELEEKATQLEDVFAMILQLQERARSTKQESVNFEAAARSSEQAVKNLQETVLQLSLIHI